MATTITWAAVGIFVFFIAVGLAMGLIRGIKRSALHFTFVIMAFVVAFFITQPIANAVLASKFPINGGSYTLSEYIIKQLGFDMTNFQSAETFISKLPSALVSPILFMLLFVVCYFLFDIIYLIVARVSFGKKKEDFSNGKAYRTYGGAIGIVEGFLFMILLFAPLTALTNTFETISHVQATTVTLAAEEQTNHLQTIPELLEDKLPKEVTEIVSAYNNSIVGKICGAGGFDNLLFDGMSSIKVNGQKIEIRKDLLTCTKIYNDFAKFYNDLTDQNYGDLNFGRLKTNINTLTESGLFRGVVSDTAEAFIKNYNQFDFVEDMPTIAKELLDDVKTALETKEISFAEYLKNDLLKIADAGSKIFDSQIVEKYLAIEEKDFLNILNFIDEEVGSQFVDDVMTDLLETNLVEDCLPTLLDYASEQVSGLVEGIEIKLNTEVTDVKGLLNETKQVLPRFIQLCEYLRLPELLEAQDKIKFFTEEIETQNLSNALDIAGETLDKVRNLEILVNGDEYVVDQILEHFEFGLIGTTTDQLGNRVYDDVYEMVEDEESEQPGARKAEKVTLDSYTKLFEHIKKPILIAKENNLLSNFDKNSITELLGSLRNDPNLIAEMVLPFKGVKALDLENQVYNQVITTLQDLTLSGETKLFDFSYLEKQGAEKDDKNFERWNEAFETLGSILNKLNVKDKVEVGEKKYSYIEYVLADGFDEQILTDSLLNDADFAETISPVFSFRLLKPMSEVFIEKIDSEIAKVTGLTSGTTYEELANDANAASTMKELLDCVKLLNLDDLDLKQVGNILDSLKENAKQHGVFEKTFFNFIWYLTGDNLCDFDLAGLQAFEQHETVKTYLEKDATAAPGSKELYLNISFVEKFDEIEKAKEIGDKLAENLTGVENVSEQNAQEFADALKNSVKDFESEDVVNVLENLEGFVDKDDLQQKIGEDPTIKNAVEEAIKGAFSDKQDVADALLSFLGLGPQA